MIYVVFQKNPRVPKLFSKLLRIKYANVCIESLLLALNTAVFISFHRR